MSSVYQPKRKELAKVKVISTQAYDNNRSKWKFIGGIKRGYTSLISTQSNKKTGKTHSGKIFKQNKNAS